MRTKLIKSRHCLKTLLSHDAQIRLVDLALSYVGHKARPGSPTDFGRRVGYSGEAIPLSGSFVDVVFYDAGIEIPSCTYAPSGLAQFLFMKRLSAEPAPGHISFYNFSTKQHTDPFSMPHCGIVVDTHAWKKDKTFVAVEAGVGSAVVKVVRRKDEMIGFGEPDWKRWPAKAHKNADGLVFVDHTRIRLGARGGDVVNVQLALAQLVGLSGQIHATFDDKTQYAYMHWQRMIGHVGVDIDGIPNERTLEQLGRRSKVFTTATSKN